MSGGYHFEAKAVGREWSFRSESGGIRARQCQADRDLLHLYQRGEEEMQTIDYPGEEIDDFIEARETARRMARDKLGAEVELWSWYDAATGQHSPSVDCCGADDEPAWEVYARVRGGRLKIVIGGRYTFYFGPTWG
jgi:hypothetical protein